MTIIAHDNALVVYYNVDCWVTHFFSSFESWFLLLIYIMIFIADLNHDLNRFKSMI